MSEEKVLDYSAKIAKLLLEIEAVKLQPENPFQWASGILSPIYCDNRKTLSYPAIRSEIARAFSEKANDRLPFDIIAGVATGGIAHGVLVADLLDMPFIYVRSSKKKHGTGQQVEGHYNKGQKCLVIEDLISTGKSSLEAVDALRYVGLEVTEVISIFTYGFEEAEQAFKKKNCQFSSLTDYSTLLKEAINQKLIKEKDLTSLQEWRTNPRKWKR